MDRAKIKNKSNNNLKKMIKLFSRVKEDLFLDLLNFKKSKKKS